MVEGAIKELKADSVSNILQHGGTILKSSRSKDFMEAEGRKMAYEHLRGHDIDAVIVIGGDGTFRGASEFHREYPDVRFIGIPGTIDNDLFGTDYTLGYDTAINTVVEAVDKIRDTAASHDRLFFVEVMGRDAGFIALRSGIGVGAEGILIPESETNIEALALGLKKNWEQHRASSIIIVAEGDDAGGAYQVAEKVKEYFPEYEARVSILGHIQRGGSPSAMDRVLAARLGNGAVEGLLKGRSGMMVGVIDRDLTFTPLEQAVKHHQEINEELLHLVETLSI